MKAEFISPFIESTVNVLETMAQTKPQPHKPAVKPDNLTRGELTGLIGMASDDIAGNMILSFEGPAILKIVSNMLMEEMTELNDDVMDAVGELTNMISGGAKAKLSEQGYSFDMATPVMVRGVGVELRQLSSRTILTIPFETEAGMFWVDANLGPASKKAE